LINRLVFENLKHRKLRTGLSALSIGFQVTMILAVVGLSNGMLQDSIDRAKGVGADIWVKPPGSSVISMGAGSMPERVLDGFFAKHPHVARATGSLVVPIAGLSTIIGINYESFSKLSGGFIFVDGGALRQPDDILVDRWYSEQTGKKVGDTVHVLNHDWHVSGVVEPGKMGRLFVDLARLQHLSSNSGKLSQVLLKLDNPANTKSVIETLKAKEELADYPIYSIEELVSQFSMNNIPGLKAFIWVIIGLSIIVGFLVVGLTMYTTVLERTREIGILKALGASPGDVMGILVRETTLLAIAGWAAGVILSFGANWAINRFVRAYLQSQIVPDWWPIVLGISLLASLLGAVYPGLRAARQDAIEALSYE